MNVKFQFAVALAASFLVAGCERTAAPSAEPAPSPAVTPAAPVSQPIAPQEAGMTGFRHEANLDMFGYYMPEGEVKLGKWVLSNIHVGTLDDLAKYERGDRDPPQYAPVMIEFFDETSPTATNELGGTYHTNQRRVLPVSYEITGNRIAFTGKDAELGDVSFDGRLDSAAVKRATAAAGQGPSDTSVVLTGKLTVGTETRDIKFTWFGGD